MNSALAQVVVEAKLRLRSTSTIFAVLGVFALTFLYLPDPGVNRVSISWRSGESGLISGLYDSTYVGAVLGMLSAMFLTLIGFYLVAGSIRRDRQRHILEIVAATPISKFGFVIGKWLAHTLYLLIVASTGLIAGLILFFRYGHGSLDLQQFLMPWLLTVPAAMAFTAAMAVLFDVTPGLRTRFGWVIWFFAWIYLFMVIPAHLAGRLGQESSPRPTNYDPAGMIAFEEMLEDTVDGADVKDLSMGVMIIDEPISRVPIGRITLADAFNSSRVWNVVWIALVLGVSTLLFRFRVAPSGKKSKRRGKRVDEPAPEALESRSSWVPTGGRHPSLFRAVTAEARLIWGTAGIVRWPFLLAALLTLVLPFDSAQGVGAIAILLLGPIVSEVAAREYLAGTKVIVVPSPAVPRSIVLWKLAALVVFALVTLSPLLLRSFGRGPDHGIAFLAGTLGTVALATGLGSLTGGGKFFTGLYVVAWYIAVQREPALDFTGWFVEGPSLRTAAIWLTAGVAAVIPAKLFEK